MDAAAAAVGEKRPAPDSEVDAVAPEGNDNNDNDAAALAEVSGAEVRPDEDEVAGDAEEGRPKLTILNAGQHLMNKKVKVQLVRNKIKHHKTVKVTKLSHAVVYFDTKEDLELARPVMETIKNRNGDLWKVVDYIRPSSDLKDYQDRGENGSKRKRARREGADGKKSGNEDGEQEPEAERTAASSTIPWASIPYEEQLVKKQFWASAMIRRVLRRLVKTEKGGSATPMEWTEDIRRQFDGRGRNVEGPQPGDEALKTRIGMIPGAPCPLEKIIASPQQEGYRNKCSFTIGRDSEGKVAVGFRVSAFKMGSVRVGRLEDCIHVPKAAREFALALEKHISESSKLAPFDLEDKSGFWQTCTVRYFESTKSLLACLVVSTKKEETETVDQELKAITEALIAQTYDGVELQSFSVIKPEANQLPGPNDEVVLLHGKPCIIDHVDGLDFEVSPNAFFQVNSSCAEALFQKIREWTWYAPGEEVPAEAKNLAPAPEGNPNGPTVLDVCCGTGTIGMCMARSAKHVVGVDMVEDGIKDARRNAELNNIKNTTFVASKIEDVVNDLLRGMHNITNRPSSKDFTPPEGLEDARKYIVEAGDAGLVAIVDPPRAGLHKRVIRELRVCDQITNLIYVSCDAELALTNFIDLCRREHGQRPGKPFRPVRAIPVDLFPHTPHCELIIQFEKITDAKTHKEYVAEQKAAKESTDAFLGKKTTTETEDKTEETTEAPATAADDKAENTTSAADDTAAAPAEASEPSAMQE